MKSIMIATLSAAAAVLAIALPPPSASAAAASVEVDTRLSHRLLREGVTQRVFVRIGVKGVVAGRESERTPANIALVIDRSGSMGGDRIAKAREAAIMAIDRLSSRDIASVVAFDDKIDVLYPAGRVENHDAIRRSISALTARGGTAIYAALEEAAREIRKNKSPGRLNRIILMSDGQANVGPSKPRDFEELGRKLGGEGISVTTIGLGDAYNEDLMARLARASDGNHAFARTSSDLTRIFNSEFDDVLSVSAQELEIEIETHLGVRPLRSLGRDSEINGNRARMRVSQVYATSQHSLQFELEIPAEIANGTRTLADITVRYRGASGEPSTLRQTISATFTASASDHEASVDPIVMEPIIELKARERTEQAIKLRDEGRVKEAKEELQRNIDALRDEPKRLGFRGSARIEDLKQSNDKAMREMDDEAKWSTARKTMRQDQNNAPAASARF